MPLNHTAETRDMWLLHISVKVHLYKTRFWRGAMYIGSSTPCDIVGCDPNIGHKVSYDIVQLGNQVLNK
jgi:hypothetical protein